MYTVRVKPCHDDRPGETRFRFFQDDGTLVCSSTIATEIADEFEQRTAKHTANDDLPSTNQHPLYLRYKEEALALAKSYPILQADVIETFAMVLENSHDISGGRASELMERLIYYLKCLQVCLRHKLMREVMGLDRAIMIIEPQKERDHA